jgi:hypothetical protein
LAAAGSYFGSVGGEEKLWFVGWADKVNRTAEGSTRRWKVLGYLQVAQAVLNNPSWPIEDAVCALTKAVDQYRKWAKDTGRVGDARDAHDIARYLYSRGVTRDGQPFLRAGLGRAEEQARRLFALRMLRVAQGDVARWLEVQSPMTHRALALSTAFRVPGLPLDWRTNPYIGNWPSMPYGFTRPMVALEMIGQGIVKFPYTFTKHDPTLRDWPEKTNLIDDVTDFVTDTWDWLCDLSEDIADYICNNQVVFSALVTGVVVGAECLGTVGGGCGAAVAGAKAQYLTVQGATTASCGAYAAAKAAVTVWNWDESIRDIVEAVVATVALPATVATPLPKGQMNLDVLVERLITETLKEVVRRAKPIVEKGLKAFREQLEEALDSPQAKMIADLLKNFDAWDALVAKVLKQVESTARRTVAKFVALRVANLRGLPKGNERTRDSALRQIFSDTSLIQRTMGAPSSARDAVRRQITQERRSGYGGCPSWVAGPYIEQSAAVANAILSGVPLDAINEALYLRGPSDDAIWPRAGDVTGPLNALTIAALEKNGLSSPYIQRVEPAELQDVREALAAARESLVEAGGLDVTVTVLDRQTVYVPTRMLGAGPRSGYPQTPSGAPTVVVRPEAAQKALTDIVVADAVFFIESLKKNPNASLISLYASRVMAHTVALLKKRQEAKAAMDASNQAWKTDLERKKAREKAARERKAVEFAAAAKKRVQAWRGAKGKGGGGSVLLLAAVGALAWRFSG